MKNNKLSNYSLAKNISYEIIIEEQLQLKSEATTLILEKYSKKRSSLKLKFISYKTINAIIFGILPIFPLIAYLELTNLFISESVHVQIAIFIKSFIFQVYFTLQFLDFFLMGLFNLINIMSGEIFEWLKTLPFSKKKLKKLALFTIIHNFDLPILTNAFVFPIIMLFATQNFIIFLISLLTSILNSIFSITVLIILGEKIAKKIKLQNLKAKKSLLFQLLNTLSYALIIFGTIFIIQIILSSMVTIFLTFANLNYSPIYNLILSLIPFPFNPSYLISIFSNISNIPIQLLFNSLFGLGLYLIILYFLFRKSLKSLNNIISLKYKFDKKTLSNKKDKLKIHTSSKIKAFIRKDLLIASRNLQTFMSLIMPITMSFVFITFFNISFVRGENLLSGDLYYNWIILIGLSPILSGMVVYNLLNMEASGKTIMGTLPIVIRDHAKAKLIIMILIQIIATIAPILVYIFHYRFLDLLLTILATLPFTLIFLLMTFLLRVRLFGKKRYFYVLDEILPQHKISKWILIFLFEYFVYFLFIMISNYIYYNFNLIVSFMILFIISFSIMVILKGIFDKFFPKLKDRDLLEVKLPKIEIIHSKIVTKPLIFKIAFGIYFNIYFISIFMYQYFEISILLFFLGAFLTLIYAVSKKIQQISLKNKSVYRKKNIAQKIINSFFKYLIVFFFLITLFFFFFNQMYVSPLTPESVQKTVSDWNNLPFWQRYFSYLKNLFTGNWEYSVSYFESRLIKELILEHWSVSLTLLVIPVCLRLLLNFKTSFSQNKEKYWKKFVRVSTSLFYALPSFIIILFLLYFVGIEIFSQMNYRILLAILILSISTLSRVVFITKKNELNSTYPINSKLKKNNKYKEKSKPLFKSLKSHNSFNALNLLTNSTIIGELIIIEKILDLRGIGKLFLQSLSYSRYIEITTIFFLFIITIISISFIQSLFKLYLHIKSS